jgi:nitrite reductase (cytochrome c-552)
MSDNQTKAPGDSKGDAPAGAVPWWRLTRRRMIGFICIAVGVAVAAALVSALLVNIFQRKQEAKNPYLKLVNVDENTTDPAVWGTNWPREFDTYQRTADTTRTRFGGSESMPEQKLDRDPWLRRMFSGYAFSIDYRDRRGHAYMLYDQEQTERVTKKPQPGACLHCHAAVIPTYRRLGGGDMMKGFEATCAMTYQQASAELKKTPDGTPGKEPDAHPVSCVDCHDPDRMELRVTRPGFLVGIRKLAESKDPLPHLASIERWREGGRKEPYDPNRDATRQEMRSFVCGQCHVEYYCGPKETLFYPWANGLKVEQIEQTYDGHKFPGGEPFYDYAHGETGARVYKAQHPEFELWNQGTHARAGVACADCHMPYTRDGAVKVSDHWVRSPLLNINRACQQCHPYPEADLAARVQTIQDRTHTLMGRSASALVDLLDAIKAAKAGGAGGDDLKPALELQRKAQWRLDFVSSENSMGFHAAQESARILAESIDYSRQGQLAAQSLLARPATRPSTRPSETAADQHGPSPALLVSPPIIGSTQAIRPKSNGGLPVQAYPADRTRRGNR